MKTREAFSELQYNNATGVYSVKQKEESARVRLSGYEAKAPALQPALH